MRNASCAGEPLELGPLERLVVGVCLGCVSGLTVVGNALVVIAVCAVKKLRRPSNYLLVSLAAADLSVATAVMPFAIVTDLTGGRWLFGPVFCNIFIGMDVMCCTASIMTLCVISVDRYLGITRPLTYPARQNGSLMAKMIAGVWLVSASITLPPFCGWAKNIDSEGVCLISQDLGYTVYSTSVAFYIPMLVMLLMYYKIFRAARESGAKHRLPSIARNPAPPPSDAHCKKEVLRTQGLELQPVAPAGPARVCVCVWGREQKAATTLGVLLGVFCSCWLPFFLLSSGRPLLCGETCTCLPLLLERLLLWLGYTNSLLNPLIYTCFNRELRSTCRELLRCRYRSINHQHHHLQHHQHHQQALRV